MFCLIFQHKNWFSLLESKKAEQSPAKDAIYRFLNQSTFNWRKFLLSFSAATIQKVDVLTDKTRPKVLIIDDSSYDRNRSKKVELLARCFDHASLKMRFYKGFRMLTLGWSDGSTFMPIDFTLLSSIKAQINGISTDIDKRTSGYKRRLDALESAPEQIPSMIHRALTCGVEASYVLMDSWFTLRRERSKGITEATLHVRQKSRDATEERHLTIYPLYDGKWNTCKSRLHPK